MRMAAALAEDPTVYQYDEVYDKIEEKKQEENVAKNLDKAAKKPRYIHNMMKNAERQKRENERRIERQVQKEREAEGEQFADKEKFVTSAYRKKMEEMAKLDEEEERQDRIEKALDVKGQKDMSGFYRHLYRQTMGEEKGQNTTEETIKDEEKVPEIKKVSTNKREYRKRDDMESEPEEEHSTSNSESSDSESSDNESKTQKSEKADEISAQEIEKQKEEKDKARKQQLRKEKEKRDRRKRRIELGQDTSSDESEANNDVNQHSPKLNDQNKTKNTDELKDDKPKIVKKPKIDIWKKVTVGDLFESALERYLIRKQSRTNWP